MISLARPLWPPGGHFGLSRQCSALGGYVFHVVRHCRWWVGDPGAAKLVFIMFSDLKKSWILSFCYYDFNLFQWIVFIGLNIPNNFQNLVLHIFQQVCITLMLFCISNKWEDLALSSNIRTIFVAFILPEI